MRLPVSSFCKPQIIFIEHESRAEVHIFLDAPPIAKVEKNMYFDNYWAANMRCLSEKPV